VPGRLSRLRRRLPTEAIQLDPGGPHVNLGRCLFCPECSEACPEGAIHTPRTTVSLPAPRGPGRRTGGRLSARHALGTELKRVLGRSLKLRVVSAGAAPAVRWRSMCWAHLPGIWAGSGSSSWPPHVMRRPSHHGPGHPEHGTGPAQDLRCGAPSENRDRGGGLCHPGGPYYRQVEQLGGASSVVPVDLYIPGCPPHPLTILDGLLRLLASSAPRAHGPDRPAYYA